MSSGWQPWYWLETLKLVFNVSSGYQGCHPDDLSVSVYSCSTSGEPAIYALVPCFIMAIFKMTSSETFSALLALCEGNPPVTGGFPLQRPVWRRFHVFFDLHMNKRRSKQSRRRWFGTPLCLLWRQYNVEFWVACKLCTSVLQDCIIDTETFMIDPVPAK